MAKTASPSKRLYDWLPLASNLTEWNISLSPDQKNQIENYLNLVACHDLESGLTADISPQNLLLRHAADALACLPFLKSIKETYFQEVLSVADLGSGAGFIGVVIKIAFPEIDMTLIEPLKKRFDFLNLTLIALGIKGIHLIRKPTGEQDSVFFDVILERAVAPFHKAVKIANPLLKPNGFFIAYQSQDLTVAPTASDAPPSILPLVVKEKFNYRLPSDDKNRYLILCRKATAQVRHSGESRNPEDRRSGPRLSSG